MSSSRKLLVALTVAVAVACTTLGFWQLDRLSTRRARNRAARDQLTAHPIDLNARGFSELSSYRRVEAFGDYDFAREIVLRGRLLQGAPGVQIVTPLRVTGQDTAILVNRGFVPTPDASYPPDGLTYAEPSRTRLRALAFSIPDAADGEPLAQARGETWYRLDLSAIRRRLPYPLSSYYLIVEADSAAGSDHTSRGRTLPIRIESPPLTDGPHLSYAIQWFLIGAMSIGFGVMFARKETGWRVR